ncbi:MAG: LysM peptidoglycan-binding domain-containing M23 family metallopeptidase [Thermodesulfobacteriota bacterium]
MSADTEKIRTPALLAALLLTLLLSGCVIGTGVTHTVKKGETLWRISRTYDVDLQDLAETNGIKDPTDIKAGMRLYIPGARRVKKVPPYRPSSKSSSKYEGSGKIEMHRGMFDWPVKGPVSSNFGPRNGVRHDGIDIRAPEGTPIKAAGKGKVVFVDTHMRGYGRIIIIKHPGDYYTVYAHNKENDVKRGDTVERGQVIGRVGDSGNADGCHLHFEVRRGKKMRNPLFFLP